MPNVENAPINSMHKLEEFVHFEAKITLRIYSYFLVYSDIEEFNNANMVDVNDDENVDIEL